MEIRDETDDVVPIHDDRVRLEEDHEYRVLGAEHAYFGERALTALDDGRGFALEITHWAGHATLRIEQDTASRTVAVEVIPRVEKLDERAWLALLDDLEAWLPGISVGLEGGTRGQVGVEGAGVPVAVVALLPLVAPLLGAALRVAEAPPGDVDDVREMVATHRVRRADREAIAWVTRRPEIARTLDRTSTSAHGLLDPRVPQRATVDTVDHAANRAIAWSLRRIASRLRELAHHLTHAARRTETSTNDTRLWCLARADATREAADAIDATLHRTVFGRLRPAPAEDRAGAARLDDPAHARFHAIAHRFLAARFIDHRGAPGPPVRPSYTLYELWTFLALVRRFTVLLGPSSQHWHVTADEPLLGGIGHGTSWSASALTGNLTVHFNPTFRSWFARGNSARYSISAERRPDLAVTWEPVDGAPRWCVLDAKYRVGRAALGDALASLHVYRDALRWEGFGGRCAGGLLISPAMRPECGDWYEPSFSDSFGAGIRVAAPDSVSSQDVVAREVFHALRISPAD